ncbi:MAG: hypothetical protein E7401_02780 [Ruminococcaceae bacterium]|nr:hypothetical protein [Oscillospiraceae bacterium]
MHNYLLNGTVKVNIGETGCVEFFNSSRRRTLLAVADGSESEFSGSDAAFLFTDSLGECVGLDFNAAYSDSFSRCNELIKGRSFRAGGKKVCVKTGILFFENDFVRAYNIGDVPIFMQRDKKIKLLSGDMPQFVEVEETVENDDEIEIKKVKKATAPYIGYMAEDCVAEPHISEKIKVKNKDTFLVLSKSVTDAVDVDTIAEIIDNDKLKLDEKAEKLMDLATEKNPEETYTIQITVAKDNARLFGVKLRYLFMAVLAAIIIVICSIFGAPLQKGAEALVEKWKIMVSSFTYRDIKPEVVADPWVPLGRNDEEEKKEKKAAEKAKQAEEERKRLEEEAKQNVSRPTPYPTTVTQPTQPNIATPEQEDENSNQEIESNNTPQPKPELPPVQEDSNVELPIDFN